MEHPQRVGKYEVEQFLGGNMARVYRAKDSVLGRRVAVKVLTESGASDGEAKARFLLEARMASNIRHENIVHVYDFGEDGGLPFMVMELLEGITLRDAIKDKSLGDFRSRMQIALQVGRALEHIHTRKIIHRDIKPENVHLDRTGRAKLMDFGIAKAEGVQLTRAGFTLGTPYYMAPEQVMGKPVTAQADVYAFGILIFELLSGVKPFQGDNLEKIFQAILYEPVNLAPLKALGIAPAAIDLITQCTMKDVPRRLPSLAAACEEIERILDPSRLRRSPSQNAPMAAAAGASSVSQASGVMKPMPTRTGPVMPTHTPLPGTMSTPVQQPQTQVSQTWGSTSWLDSLPAVFRSPGGLMFLGAMGVMLGMLILSTVLSMLHII